MTHAPLRFTVASLVALFIWFGLDLLAPAEAQPRGERPGEPRMDFLMYEAIAMPALDSSFVRVDVPYRIDADFFIPVRNTEADARYPFHRRGEVLVELIDSTGISRARSIEQIDAGTDRSERDPFVREWVQGLASLRLPPGLYTIVIELTDLNSQRHQMERSRTVRVSGPRAHATEVSAAFFTAGFKEPVDTLTMLNYGGNILFGAPAQMMVLLPGAGQDMDSVFADYTLKTLDRSGEEATLIQPIGLRPVKAIPNVALEPLTTSPNVRYRVRTSPASHTTAAIIPIPTQTLPLRRFSVELTLRYGKSVQKISREFRALWPDMPQSLKDVDNALDALRYIVSERALDSLRHGDFETRRNNLEEFWKTRDRTPETAYNEIETEYYQRVDYAVRTFGTLRQPDGSRTDRGKIFILYGPPTATERTLDPKAGYKEVWTYEHLKKKFIFADLTRSGNYMLISTNAL